MAKTNFLISMRSLLLLILFHLLPLGLKAQTTPNPVLTWDHEVGCIKYSEEEDGKQKHLTFIERIKAGICLRVCENTRIKYTFRDNDVEQVAWEIIGGELEYGGNTGAVVVWGDKGNGMIILTITYKNGFVDVLKICVEKVAKPIAKFGALNTEDNLLCSLTPIAFQNDSNANGGSDIVHYHWDFGDGTTSSAFEPTHTFTQPGEYSVRLTVTNSCNCSHTYEQRYRVLENKEFEISCPSVVCEESTQTYSVNDSCGGKWEVRGGTIISDSGTSIEVVWDNVDPETGFGYIQYQSDCNCKVPTIVKVPVILSKGKIKGPTFICEGDQARFSLPQWPTTDFVWAINDDPNHPMLTRTEQRNEIIVNGTIPGSYVLSARYRNTLINSGKCMGFAEIKFEIKKRPEISTDDPLIHCERADMSFYSVGGSDIHWKITKYNTVVHQSYGATLSYRFDNPGIYLIESPNEDRCDASPITVQILAKPVIQTGIIGPSDICLNTPYTYSVEGQSSSTNYLWTVTNGTIVGDNTGNEVTIKFTGSPATVQVIKKITQGRVSCVSEPVNLEVKKIDLNPIIVNNSGLAEFCTSSTATFSVNLGETVPDHIEWSLTSDATSGNFGSILSGINDPTVTVALNEISTSPTGTLKVKVFKCGTVAERTFQIRLLQNPVLTIGNIGSICPSQDTVTIPFTITPAALPSTDIRVFIDGVFQGSYPYSGNTSLTIPNTFSNNTSSNVSRSLKLEVRTCNRTASTSKNVTVLPGTQISISPSYHYSVCPTNYPPIQLTSTISTGITSSVEFKWYKSGSSTVLSTQPNLTISGANPGGSYYLEVKDINGCLVRSQTVYVVEDCSTPGTPTPCNYTANVTATWSSCGEITAVLQSNATPASITWSGSTGLSLVQSTQNTPTAKFTATAPGVYIVQATVNFGSCTLTKSFSVTKNYQPKLVTAVTCNGNGTYNVTLHNNSLVAAINPANLTYSYSGPGVPASATGNSYTLTNVAPGNYTYNLAVSSPGNPTCTVSASVNLPALPSANFTIPPQIPPYCSEELIPLTIPNYNPDNRYEWKFGIGTNTTSYFASGATTKIQLSEPGTYTVWLKITTPNGCIVETATLNRQHVTVTKANFRAAYYNLFNNEFCEGSNVPISIAFLQGGTATSTLQNIIWMQGNQQVGTGLTYVPTQSGSYWPILIDQNGCKSYQMATSHFSYTLKKPPVAKVSGSLSVCGSTISLTGVTTNNDVEHRWTGNGVPLAYTNWVSGNTYKTLTLNNMAPGTYSFTFYTRLPNDPSCVGSYTVSVVVKPAAPSPSISYAVVSCSPFKIKLTATGPDEGMYNWSNGMTGKEIIVLHGGAYSVTYTAPNGCSASGSIQTPHDIDRNLLWSIPSGCYTVCDPAYILGPLGTYPNYEWLLNDNVTQEGHTTIPDQHYVGDGTYQLVIEQEGCIYESNAPVIKRDFKACPPENCNFKIGFEPLKVIPELFMYNLYIYNPYNYAITVHLSSLFGYGTFNPSSITLQPGNNTTYVEFHTNSTFTPGVSDGFVINGPNCADIVEISLTDPFKSFSALTPSSVTLSPNPANHQTTVSYRLGDGINQAQRITVYDLLGIQRHQQAVSGTEGEVTLNVSHLTNGTYLIILEADGQRVATAKLIKN